jgi:hypothetical protein
LCFFILCLLYADLYVKVSPQCSHTKVRLLCWLSMCAFIALLVVIEAEQLPLISEQLNFGGGLMPHLFSCSTRVCLYENSLPQFSHFNFLSCFCLMCPLRKQCWKRVPTAIIIAFVRFGSHMDYWFVSLFTFFSRKCLVTVSALGVISLVMNKFYMKIQLRSLGVRLFTL